MHIWAREVGLGRLLYNAAGFSGQVMAQQDSIVPKLYWEHLRYVAGDYQNGCADPYNPGYDPDARVHDESMCAAAGLKAAPARSRLVVSKGSLRMQIEAPEGPFQARLSTLQGKRLWERDLPAGTDEIAMDAASEPGLYFIELQGGAGTFRSRLLLP